MNREETKKAIEVMQAWVDGKEIQVEIKGGRCGWGRADAPCWEWNQFNYRIKPQPREFWIVVGAGESQFTSYAHAKAWADKYTTGGKITHFREVLED